MIASTGYAVHHSTDTLAPWNFERRALRDTDVLIHIDFSGVCHSDIHQARNEWGNSMYPMVPGHEIVGHVAEVGQHVTRFKKGDVVGVGCMVNSCRTCPSCNANQEQFCENFNTVYTYNSYELDKKTYTYGGYSNNIVVHQDFVLRISPSLPLHATAPLLCAGITTYSPIMRYKIGKGDRLGVLGLGGLGHMAVKFGVSTGAHVTVLSTSPSKREDALRLGAHEFVNTNDKEHVKKYFGTLNYIIDAVSAVHSFDFYLQFLKTNGIHICVGIPTEPLKIQTFSLMTGNKSITASSIGGIQETQEMLDYCAAHNITSDVEMIQMHEINTAYERMLKNDVKYRFVIDMKSLGA